MRDIETAIGIDFTITSGDFDTDSDGDPDSDPNETPHVANCRRVFG
jgi:hypothetical protein